MNYEFDRTLNHRNNFSYKWNLRDGRNDFIGMGTADMDFSCPPCVRDASKLILEENTFNYRRKPEQYYQTVLSWYKRKYGLIMDKSWLSNVPGTIAAIYIALQAYTKPGDAVLMQTPGFGPLKRAIEGAGCKILANPMVLKDCKYEIDLEDFEKKIHQYRPSVFLMVNPQNPTGRAFTLEELTSLVEICEKYHVLIISNEVHSLIIYNEHRHTPILSVSEKARRISVQIMSMSKGFNLMGLPHAIISIADSQLKKQWDQKLIPYSFDYATNAYSLAAAEAVMNRGADKWLTQVTAYLQKNRDTIIDYITNHHYPIIPVKPEAGYLLWVDCRMWAKDNAVSNMAGMFLEKSGISLVDGEEFGLEGKGFVRMNFALPSSVLHMALEHMKTAFER
ncbi:MAG: aminotransferase class I/II-fold pyridoxal phosphate-dependent enzyme [Eubacteriales bacterium]|nr:aminotransferase class I/II-fold pyridoxal phosphate-dependent enzyme [Eubacteriales bacterium]